MSLLEREEDGKRSICKVTFGAEPKDGEVWGFVLTRYGRMKFSPAQPVKETAPIRSPKRAQREIRKAVLPMAWEQNHSKRGNAGRNPRKRREKPLPARKGRWKNNGFLNRSGRNGRKSTKEDNFRR